MTHARAPGTPVEPATQTGGRVVRFAPAILIIVWIALAAALSTKRLPWSNEAWAANPALTFLAHGYLGTPILEGKQTWLAGVDRHLYWMMPLHSLAQALWYKLAGFSLIRQRLLSVAFGALALAAWYRVVLHLALRPVAACVAVAVIGFERNFLTVAANGRMDMMAAALGITSLAVFLYFHSRRWLFAVALSNVLAAAASWTHPCGALFAACLLATVIVHRPPRLPLIKTALVTVLPYFVAAALWGIYIAQAPADFLRQFVGNVSGFASEYTGRTRLSFFEHPLAALWSEWYERYYAPFFLDAPARLGHLDRLMWLIAALLALVLSLASPRLRKARGVLPLAAFSIGIVLLMAVFEGMKFENYLVYSLPFFGAVLAAVSTVLWNGGRRTRIAGWLLLAACLPQLVEVAHALTVDHVKSALLPAGAFVQSRIKPADRVIAPAEFAYVFGFDGPVTDDVRLGYFTGLRPAFIVTNDWYRAWHRLAATRDPALGAYLRLVLTRQYRPVAAFGPFRIYARLQPASP